MDDFSQVIKRDGTTIVSGEEGLRDMLVMDAIYKAVKELSAEGSYAVIFDTASGASILYSNPRYDLSDEVLKKLGYKN